ncbi:universal stress protein [Primorskyibacter aestuariivivens]|uniref:universal stress protein n=1 Tax=Primorskyibacter aestuariivivens TaxID=1888912 RepID=UPI0023006F39|nr:universal stress protein [Primorskyibacter aestuariivivens]MDA7429862.1 universal stress protein [Primorskyibacter aestuariivivens]
MFTNIIVPVDLAHEETLSKALQVSADLAKHYGAKVTYLGVTSNTPSSVAHNPDEFAEKLARFAAAQGEVHGVEAGSHAAIAHDPTVDVDDVLLRAVGELAPDLVVMASHVPGIVDYVWPSNGGKIAGHAKASVMVVRD